jgi:DNA processing protein
MLKYVTIRNGDAAYPTALASIPKPPAVLYVAGDPAVLKTACVAIVGTRKASPYGAWCAYELGKRAASYGITVVSGMASGIDAEAHRGALDGGGRTIAVLGSGVDVCYPESNRKLYERIPEKGAVISELEPGTHPLPMTFPARNRIISGLSGGVIVVEAALKSGSLITADHAVQQGREVLAVPGNLNQVFSYGCNKLIRDGAMILTLFDDILDLVGLEARDAVKEKRLTVKLNRDEARIYKILREEGELTVDALAVKTAMNPGDLAAVLTYMEIRGVVCSDYGRVFLTA